MYDVTSRFLSGLIRYLNVQLAPRIIKHGVLVEVYGEGVLILDFIEIRGIGILDVKNL